MIAPSISSHSLLIRAAQPQEATILFDLIVSLAEYEQLAHEVTGNPEALKQHLFGQHPCIEAIVAEAEGELIGFALFFVYYSTSLTQPKIYLEDLFVLPQARGKGIGKALLSCLAKLVTQRGYGGLEWSVLDWNAPAIGFYQSIGAQILADARVCRVAGAALPQLALQSPPLAQKALRWATPSDSANIFSLVKANIEYDGGLAAFNGSEVQLAEHLFNHAYAEVLIAEQDDRPVGLALFCTNYSTFLTKPGLFVEDLFVLPDYRGQRMGKALLSGLAQQVIDRGYGRLEWHVRTWNQPAIEFYQRIGAQLLPDWRICQINATATEQLATIGNSV
jgi:GNAT superfamily N-acetyltransferase